MNQQTPAAKATGFQATFLADTHPDFGKPLPADPVSRARILIDLSAVMAHRLNVRQELIDQGYISRTVTNVTRAVEFDTVTVRGKVRLGGRLLSVMAFEDDGDFVIVTG
jgi:hypothetical protein